jgi:hypothetical protein
MRANFLGQLKAAKTIERAVHAEDEQIRVGLMMSTEPQQAMQGRGMAELLAVFAKRELTLEPPMGEILQVRSLMMFE